MTLAKTCLRLIGMLSIIGLIILFESGCKKDEPSPPIHTDSIVVVPPIPADTITNIRRLEEDYIQGNPGISGHSRAYTFYYDNNKRVIRVGIKNYGGILFDTATCILNYVGTNPKPYMIITPNIHMSDFGQPLFFDTTYFKYNAAFQITSDSSLMYVFNPATSAYIKRPLNRYYIYPDSSKTIVNWMAAFTLTDQIETLRSDTISHLNNHRLVKFKTQLFISPNTKANYAIADVFTYTNYINPLSQLNISGTIFSLIYTSVNKEVLGNSNHQAISNTNILPYYLDFFSPNIPSSFYLGGYTASNFLISAQYDLFDITITPWATKPTYPSQISVGATTALGSRFIYKYYY